MRRDSLEKSLRDLFWLLIRKIPLTYILFTPAYEDEVSKHVFVSYSGAVLQENTRGSNQLDMRKIMEHRRRFSKSKIHYIRADDAYCPIFPVISEDIKISAPCLYFYFFHNGTVHGSIYFGCDASNKFSRDDISFLRLLWNPLFFVIKSYVQQKRYEKTIDMVRSRNKTLQDQIRGFKSDIVGINSGLRSVAQEIRRLAPFDISVLIIGETGTGKDIFASELHRLSPRSKRNFVPVNCGGIAPSLIDSELFGYAKGAFTGAFKDYKGRFERANGGTLFLDEIAELPLEAQTRLLRVIQNHTVERLGGSEAIPVDFRLVAATNKDLMELVRKGEFREDLYFRLAGVTVEIPPLRSRPGDIPRLIQHTLTKEAARYGVPVPPLAEGELEKMLDFPWPGNVRQLINVVTEGFVRSMTTGAVVFHLTRESTPGCRKNKSPLSVPSWADAEREYFDRLLRFCGGRISGKQGAADIAGLKPNTLRARLDKLGVPYGRKLPQEPGS
ncbi:MAG: sigma-54 dependent transcriptional regulator [Mailhella sp.]|nr:sigma-54 dependent transcriptional regulator [Mailhella sp.]